MPRKPNQRQRANLRIADARRAATALPGALEERRRVPLAGYEGLYEITRDGHVYSVRQGRFIEWAYFESGPYIKFQVDGAPVTLSIRDAVTASWAGVPDQLYRVEIPATTLVVLARDERQAREVVLGALRELAGEERLGERMEPVSSAAELPEAWRDAIPYSAPGVNDAFRSIAELLADVAPPDDA